MAADAKVALDIKCTPEAVNDGVAWYAQNTVTVTGPGGIQASRTDRLGIQFDTPQDARLWAEQMALQELDRFAGELAEFEGKMRIYEIDDYADSAPRDGGGG
jgi:hypothetical protein